MIKHTLIVTVAVFLLAGLVIVLSGCQWDSQANNSIRFLMENEDHNSRNTWAFGNMR